MELPSFMISMTNREVVMALYRSRYPFYIYTPSSKLRVSDGHWDGNVFRRFNCCRDKIGDWTRREDFVSARPVRCIT